MSAHQAIAAASARAAALLAAAGSAGRAASGDGGAAGAAAANAGGGGASLAASVQDARPPLSPLRGASDDDDDAVSRVYEDDSEFEDQDAAYALITRRMNKATGTMLADTKDKRNYLVRPYYRLRLSTKTQYLLRMKLDAARDAARTQRSIATTLTAESTAALARARLSCEAANASNEKAGLPPLFESDASGNYYLIKESSVRPRPRPLPAAAASSASAAALSRVPGGAAATGSSGGGAAGLPPALAAIVGSLATMSGGSSADAAHILLALPPEDLARFESLEIGFARDKMKERSRLEKRSAMLDASGTEAEVGSKRRRTQYDRSAAYTTYTYESIGIRRNHD